MKASADPNLIVYFDGKYMPLRDAQVNILTHALHYGTGVFEGIHGCPYLFHLRRSLPCG